MCCAQVGRTETAGSNGRPETRDKGGEEETVAQQQMQQLKKQHRLQLQERNRQICHLQEDREKLRRSLRKAEDDLRSVWLFFLKLCKLGMSQELLIVLLTVLLVVLLL